MAFSVSTGFAAKEKLSIEGAFYGNATTWIDVTQAAINATYIKDGILIIPMKETVNNDEIFDGKYTMIVILKFRDRLISMMTLPQTPFPIKITPEILENEYEKAKDRPIIKTRNFDILGAFFGGNNRIADVTHKMPEFISGNESLNADAVSKTYEYDQWTPQNDRALAVFYKDKKGIKIKSVMESDQENLTIP